MLKVKDNLPFKELRKYGFRPWEEWDDGVANIYPSKGSWLIFALDPEEDRYEIMYAEDDLPACYIEIDPETRRLWCEAIPFGTYHISGWELDIITDTIYKMAQDGILEVMND